MKYLAIILLLMIDATIMFAQRPVTDVEIDSTNQQFRKSLSVGTQVWLRDSSQIYRLNLSFAAGNSMQDVFSSSNNYDLLKAGAATNAFVPAIYEKELADNETEITVPFTLLATSVIYVNGIAQGADDWTGVGTINLSLLIPVKQYDKLIIKK